MATIAHANVCKDKYRGMLEYAQVRWMLVGAAKTRRFVLYSDIAAVLGITTTGNHMSREVGQVLGEIAEDEVHVGRPMLSAVAIGVNRVAPSFGFFDLANGLGLIPTKGENIQFWLEQLQKCFDAY